MLITIWSTKGGSGCTVVASGLAAVLAQRHGRAVLVDLAGDAPAVLGLAEPVSPGVTDWLAADGDHDALNRLLIPARDDLDVLPLGSASEWAPNRSGELIAALSGLGAPVVVDAGVLGSRSGRVDRVASLGASMAAEGTSILVIRCCYLALRRAVGVDVSADGVVVVVEAGRSLDRRDIADVLGLPVVATVDVDPAVARAVDSGLLARRLPRGLERSLRRAA